ncbi:hypothetical protein BGZ83_004039, partial [Gryganskiella cystojenkinii]
PATSKDVKKTRALEGLADGINEKFRLSLVPLQFANKLRTMKKQFVLAKQVENATGSGNLPEDTLKKQVQGVFPYYYDLKRIWGSTWGETPSKPSNSLANLDAPYVDDRSRRAKKHAANAEHEEDSQEDEDEPEYEHESEYGYDQEIQQLQLHQHEQQELEDEDEDEDEPLTRNRLQPKESVNPDNYGMQQRPQPPQLRFQKQQPRPQQQQQQPRTQQQPQPPLPPDTSVQLQPPSSKQSSKSNKSSKKDGKKTVRGKISEFSDYLGLETIRNNRDEEREERRLALEEKRQAEEVLENARKHQRFMAETEAMNKRRAELQVNGAMSVGTVAMGTATGSSDSDLAK